MVSQEAVQIATTVLARAAQRPCLVLEHQLFTGTQPLSMIVVAVFLGLAFASQMVVIAALAMSIHTLREAVVGFGVHAGKFWVQTLVVDVEHDVAPGRRLLRGDVDGFRGGSAFADGSPGIGGGARLS